MSQRKISGFTLIEMLVALAIASMVLLCISAVVLSLSRHNTTVIERGRDQQALREVVATLQQELTALVYDPPPGIGHFSLENRDLYGRPTSSLEFSSITIPVNQKTSDQVMVRYQVIETAGTQVLIRARKEACSTVDLATAKSYQILSNLDGFLVECFDGSSWVRTWDAALQPKPPQQIRITITVKRNSFREPYRFIVVPRITPNA